MKRTRKTDAEEKVRLSVSGRLFVYASSRSPAHFLAPLENSIGEG